MKLKPIVALSTYPANCAIHIIRVSGVDTYKIINKICLPKIKRAGYIIQRTNIYEQKQKIDSVLINSFVSPTSFTGEDLVEINCHGSLFVANKIINLLIKQGCKAAKPGEFLERAFINKKISISEAEAINNLINANNEKALMIANSGLDKSQTKTLTNITNELFNVMGNLEVSIDYPEYEQKINNHVKTINKILKQLETIKNNSLAGQFYLHSYKIAIVGDANVGKSSLFNLLINKQKAIVTNIPGTTTDIVEGEFKLNNINIKLYDTAGIHTTKHVIEQIGISKTKNLLNDVDLILLVSVANTLNKLELKTSTPVLEVYNKIDLIKNKPKGILLSVKNNDVGQLLNKLKSIIQSSTNHKTSLFTLQSQRAIGLVQEAINCLNKVNEVQSNLPEYILPYLHSAHNLLLACINKNKEYDFQQELFRKFCVGK